MMSIGDEKLEVPISITIADPLKLYQRYLSKRVTQPDWLNVSRPIDREMRLSPRELYGLLIMYYIMSNESEHKWAPGLDPFGKDGVLVRLNDNPADRAGIIIEQTLVNDYYKEEDPREAILKAIRKKEAKGVVYADREALVVFCNKGGQIEPHTLIDDLKGSGYLDIALIMPKGHHSLKVWVALVKTQNGTNPMYEVELDPISGAGSLRKPDVLGT